MHISEGVLSGPILVTGAVIAAGGIVAGLKTIRPEQMMGVALFSALFFVASLVHIPLSITSVHLVLTGLLGVSLGVAAFPAIFIALLLQGFLFQMGGITTLGINTCIMAIPAVACFYVMRPFLSQPNKTLSRTLLFCCGAIPILLSAIMAATCLFLSGSEFTTPAITLLIAHIPVAVIEGIITLAIIEFLRNVRPELLLTPIESALREGTKMAERVNHNSV